MAIDLSKEIVFDRMLLDYTIELREALAVRRYAALSPEERAEIQGANGVRTFTHLDSALTNPHAHLGDKAHRERESILSECRPAIAILVRWFGLSTRRDPRRMIASSSYRSIRSDEQSHSEP